MARRTRPRGRPKGTGVNDRARLEAISCLIEKNPGMKPTTAIRTIGISDPSAIRRLREKLKAERQELELRAPSVPQAQPSSPETPSTQVPVVISAASVPSVPRRPVQDSSADGGLALPAPTPASGVPGNLWLDFYTAGVSAASVAFCVQMFAFSSALSISPLGRMQLREVHLFPSHDWLELDDNALLPHAGGGTVH